jgi:hypothetical protein
MGIFDGITNLFKKGSGYKEGITTQPKKFDLKCRCGRTFTLELQARNALFVTLQCPCGMGETVSVKDD